MLAVLTSAHAVAGECGGALGAASDNIYRGISLTDDRPAWIADFHCEYGSGWLAGVGATRVHLPGRSANTQATLYLDRRWQLDEDWSAKVGVVHYDAPTHARRDGLRYDEINATIGYRGFWRATVALSPNATDQYFGGVGKSHRTVWAETTFHQPIVGRLAADLGLGIAKPDGYRERSYRYGSVGASYGVGNVYIYASRVWTDTLTWSYLFEITWYTATVPSHARWVGSVVVVF